MKNRNVQKLEAITPGTLIVGVDIAKKTQDTVLKVNPQTLL